jgi:rare lipoprotein A (peptidoglycan hydrolase)
MIAQAATVMRRPHALYLLPRAAIRLALSFRWPAITPGAIRYRNTISALMLAAATFALAAAALTIMNYQEVKQDTAAIAPVRNGTIIFRWDQQTYVETSDDHDEAVRSNYPRVVRTVRFVSPNARQNIVTKGERLSEDGGRYSVGKSYTVRGRTYVPTDNPTYRAEGIASWYGPDFQGRQTANGERFDMHGISAAHTTMPLPSYARVTNLDNGRSIIVRVNNRGPFAHNRIVDLSIGTAKALDFYRKGTARVRVEFVGRAPIEGNDNQMLLATLRAGTPAPAPSNVLVASARSTW